MFDYIDITSDISIDILKMFDYQITKKSYNLKLLKIVAIIIRYTDV
jgi:hypothetical protein